jgi:DNA-binding response OmpR family regulator
MSDGKRYDGQPPADRPRFIKSEPGISASMDNPPAAEWPVASGDSTRSLLVVDDDLQVVSLVAKMGVRMGCRCTTAADALDALFYLNQSHHDLVITDFDMPLMDGIQLAERIKGRHHHTRVILMTGLSEAVIKERMGACTSVDGVIFKPFNLNGLRDKIEAVCRLPINVDSP